MQRPLDFGGVIGDGLKFGVTGVPTLLRLGWLPILLMGASTVLMLRGGATLLVGPRMARSEGAVSVFQGYKMTFEAVTSPGLIVGGALLLILGIIAFLPTYVGLIRRAAGLPTRQGGLGGYVFDERAWRVLAAGILYTLLLLAGLVFWLAPTALLMHLGGGLAGAGAVLLFLVGIGALIFVGVRLTLFVPLAGAEGSLSFREAWNLTSGNFWSILGASIIAGIVAAIIGVFIQLLGALVGAGIENATMMGGAGVEAAHATAKIITNVFQQLVSVGLAGAILRDLRGYGEPGVETPL